MRRFNFLHDAPPDVIDRLRALRVTDELRTPLLALVTSILVVFAWYGLERYWLASAEHEEVLATTRLAESRADLATTKLVRADVDQLLALDRRLRDIRLSGTSLAENLSDIGNHVPAHAWLTSISNVQDGLEISGRADSLISLSETVADLLSSRTAMSPTLVRASKDDRAKNLVAFTVQVKKRHESR